jgi:H+/Cl- antiporter ClcA
MSYVPGNSDEDLWAFLGAILATLVGLFVGTTLARRAAERRAAAIEEAEAAAHETASAADFLDSVPQP